MAPKTNQAGSTFYGQTGIVDNAHGELSELDPSRNVDGSVVDGYESDERDIEDVERGDVEGLRADSTLVHPQEPVDQDESDGTNPTEKERSERAGLGDQPQQGTGSERQTAGQSRDEKRDASDSKEDTPSAGSSSKESSPKRQQTAQRRSGNGR